MSLLGALKRFILEHKKIARPDTVITTLNGDFLSPSTLSIFDFGETMVKVLNEIGITFTCFGNQYVIIYIIIYVFVYIYTTIYIYIYYPTYSEFDIPFPILEKRIKELKTTILNSNIQFLLPETKGLEKLCAPYATLELSNKAKVRFFGYLTEETQETLQIVNGNKPLPINILPVIDKATQDIQRTIYGNNYNFSVFENNNDNECQSQDSISRTTTSDAPDAIVILTHQFIPFDRMVCQNNCNGLNIILGGHEHDPFLEIIEGINILKSGSDSNYCGIVYMDFILKEKNPDGTYKEVEVCCYHHI